MKTVLSYLEENSPYSEEELIKMHNKSLGDKIVSQNFIDFFSDSLKKVIWSDAYDDTCYTMKDFEVDEKGRVSFYHSGWREKNHLGAHLEDVLENFLGE